MSSDLVQGGPKTLANQFRSTCIYGVLNAMDNSYSQIPARAAFGRDVLVGENLFLEKAEQDASRNFFRLVFEFSIHFK